MNAPVIVPDASVLIKWSFNTGDEDDRERAIAIRQMWIDGLHRIILPSLWIYEVGNILGRKQPGLARELLDVYAGYQFEEECASGFFGQALEIMSACKVTFYDAAYHSVALKHGGVFVTADRLYVRRAVSFGHVMLLEEWPL